MTQVAIAEKTEESVLSHREAQMLLRTIPLDTNQEEFTKDQVAGARHYLKCKGCQEVGLIHILEIPEMECQKAIEMWLSAELYGGGADEFSAETLKGLVAVEHIFGRKTEEGSTPRYSTTPRFGECESKACVHAREGWHPLSVYDRHIQAADHHRRMLHFFADQKWEVDKLLNNLRKLLGHASDGKLSQKQREANLAIDMLCEMAAVVAKRKNNGIEKVLAHSYELQRQLIMRNECKNAGKSFCGFTARDRDCGTNCLYTSALISTLHRFVSERATGKRQLEAI